MGMKNDGSSGKTRKVAFNDQVEEMEIKPWKPTIAKFMVKTPTFGQNKGNTRVKQIREMKSAAMKGLTCSPYIQVVWENKEETKTLTQRGLLDTGADWSLISLSELTEQEQASLCPLAESGKGVSGEEIKILGEVWKTLRIGDKNGPIICDQRFVVVEHMVTPLILGADFWSRLPPIILDFNSKTLTVKGFQKPISLYDTSTSNHQEKEPVCSMVYTMQRITIPPRSEMLIQGFVDKALNGHEVIVEPNEDDTTRVRPAYCVVKITEQMVPVRMINVSDESQTLDEQQIIARVTDDYWITQTHAGRGFRSCTAGAIDGTGRTERKWSEGINKSLKTNQKDELECLLESYNDVFYDGGELPLVEIGVEHTLRLSGNEAPIASRPRRLSPELEKEVRAEVDELQKMGVIRMSNSPWAAPIVCARRANGKLRLVIDYRGLNKISSPATLHPIPVIDNLLDRLGTANFFSVLDAKAGYHQMPLKREDSEATAFVVPWGQYEWNDCTPFGLKGAGYSFQRLMSMVLGECNFTAALCYLDDILVWGKTWREHMDRLRVVLAKIRKAGLALSPNKCKFGVQEVQYLGCVIRKGMLCLSKQRVEQITQIEKPSNVQELQRALGAFAYVQRWIPGLAELAHPLYSAITDKKYSRLKWDEEMDEAFVHIKQAIATATALHIPDYNKEFILVTDSSDRAAGAMLAQRDGEDDTLLRPVAYYHHALTKAKQKYDTTEKELLAVVYAVKKYRVYLSKKFRLITDHRALKWLNTLDMNDQKGRRGRWIEFLQQYDFETIHKSGKSAEMTIADFLSRVTASGDYRSKEKIAAAIKWNTCEFATTIFDMEEIKAGQNADPIIKAVMIIVRQGGTLEWRRDMDIPTIDKNDIVFKDMLRKCDRLFVDTDGIMRIRFNGGRRSPDFPFGKNHKNRVVVPSEMKEKVLQLAHDAPMSGHMGIDRTWKKVRDTFWWSGNMKKEVVDYVSNCDRCGRNKHWNHSTRPPLQRTDIPDKPLDKLQVDFLGPFQQAYTHDFRYVLQVQDVLSRFLMLIPCVNDTAETAADMIVDKWLCALSSYPKKITSDRGSHFAGAVFEAMCQFSGIKHSMGAPGHPQSQGQVERQQQLLNQVRALCNNDLELWPQAVLRIQYSHNTAVSTATGMSPASLVLGVEPVLPEDLATEQQDTSVGREPVSRRNKELQIRQQKERAMKIAIDRAKDQIMYNQDRRLERLNESNDCESYNVGQTVRYRLTSSEKNVLGGKKMAPRNSDLYVITRILPGGWTYQIEPLPGSMGRPKVRNHTDLIPGPSRRSIELTQESPMSLPDSNTPPLTPITPNLHDALDQHWRGTQYDESADIPEDFFHDSSSEEEEVMDEYVPYRTRTRRPPERLQVDPSKKRYEGYRIRGEDSD